MGTFKEKVLVVSLLLSLSFISSTSRLAGEEEKAHSLEDDLYAEFQKIKIIDHHSHANEYDVIRSLGISTEGAWMNLFQDHKPGIDVGSAYQQALDQAGIETTYVNAAFLDPSLNPVRFRWVPYVDQFLYPFDNNELKGNDFDKQFVIGIFERSLERTSKELGQPVPTRDFDGYVEFVNRALDQFKAKGTIALKFMCGYARTLHFEAVSETEARTLFNSARGGKLEAAKYKRVQDYIARHIVGRSIELKLPVQIHSSWGPTHSIKMTDSSPMSLEELVTDPSFREARFVLLHAGDPFNRAAAWLAFRPNVYMDFGPLPLLWPVPRMAEKIREWMELNLLGPEKLLFSTDVSGDETGYVVAAEKGRRALARALAGMVEDGLMDREAAVRAGKLMLRDSAAAVYGQ